MKQGKERELNAERLHQALDLMELGIQLQRQKILRQNPGIEPETARQKLQAWIEEQKGTEVKELS